MIDYEVFNFAAAPRTGSTWFIKAMAMAGFREGFKTAVHVQHKDEPSQKLRISTVRRPVNWLRSCFCSIHKGSCGIPEVDCLSRLPGDDFNAFVENYLDSQSGGIGRMIDSYHADVYLRIEDMPWALAELLESVDVPRERRQVFYSLREQNPSRNHPIWHPQLKKAVVKAEFELMERFDYY